MKYAIGTRLVCRYTGHEFYIARSNAETSWVCAEDREGSYETETSSIMGDFIVEGAK